MRSPNPKEAYCMTWCPTLCLVPLTLQRGRRSEGKRSCCPQALKQRPSSRKKGSRRGNGGLAQQVWEQGNGIPPRPKGTTDRQSRKSRSGPALFLVGTLITCCQVQELQSAKGSQRSCLLLLQSERRQLEN